MGALMAIHGDLKAATTVAQMTATTVQQVAISSQQAVMTGQETHTHRRGGRI